MISILLYLHVMRILPAHNSEPLNPALPWVLGALGVADLGIGQWMRSKQLRLAFETLRTTPDDPTALARWRRGVIIGDCLAIAVVLYGFAIYFLGGSARQVAPFFIVGAAAMLFWWPREP
jgi:hypothetical protein